MKILLTGATSFIGHALSKTLNGNGYEISTLVRNKTDCNDEYIKYPTKEKLATNYFTEK